VLADCPAMRDLLGLLLRVAPLELPVLLQGESGTGKEALARALHDHGEVAGGPWEVVDCTLLRDPQLMRSELFGHVEGAFTGAGGERDGAFVRAHGGTLFLDEVAELSPELQPQLLRVLQEGEVRPLGAEATTRVRVRVVSATHRDLEAMARRGEFRQDLLYRLAAVQLEVPPLRARGRDIELLAEHFLPEGLRLGADARDALARHPWPGNVRELRQTIQRAAALGTGSRLGAADLGLGERPAALPPGEPDGPPPESPRRRVEAITDAQILAALERCDGNRAAAARDLGMGRRTLFRRLAKLRDQD